MWDRIEDRLALLELLTEGRLRRRRAQDVAFNWLSELGWTQASGRRDELALVSGRTEALVDLLDRVWPVWREEHLALLESGEPPTPSGWRDLENVRRAASLPDLPFRLNRRTAAALAAPDSKAALTGSRLDALGDREITDDGLVRIRPPSGLVARRGAEVLDLDPVQAVLGEVALTDRALRDGLILEGPIRAVLWVENLGTWRDMVRPEGWMLVHVPGWNTTTARQLAEVLGGIPMMHFGDLDPNGVRIYRHLRAHLPHLRWLVPSFWEELVETHGLPRQWPLDLDLTDAPPLVRRLAKEGRWLEQERLGVDQRLQEAMDAALNALAYLLLPDAVHPRTS